MNSMNSPLHQYEPGDSSRTRNPMSTRLRQLSLSLYRSFAPHHAAEFVSEFVSPVPHLLTSNAAPSESEKILIQDAIESVSNELSEASFKASHTSKVDSVVQRRLEAGAEFIQAHKAVLSSVRLVPPEIIAEIIRMYCKSFLLAPQPHNIALAAGSVIYPDIPSRVSRLWRSTALSLHHLWGQLVVHEGIRKWNKKQPSKLFLRRLTALVDRSQDAPLCVYFCMNSSTNLKNLLPVIDLLASHSERWHTAYLTGPHAIISAFQSIRGRLPLLKRLFLSISSELDHIIPVNMFEIAPQLEEVHLLTVFYSFKLLIPWSQLKVFSDRGGFLNGITTTHPTFLLPESLTDIELSSFPIQDLQKPRPDIPLHNLRTMNIHLYDNDSDDEDFDDTLPDIFLQNLSIPAINSIKISNYPTNIMPPIISLIKRSQMCMVLQELCLSTTYMVQFEPGEMVSLLQLTPFLKKLSIYFSSIPGDLSRLIIQPGRPTLLPRLEELYIFVSKSFDGGSPKVFSQLTQSRCESLNDFSDPVGAAAFLEDSDRPLRLKHLRIIFPCSVSCHSGQELLEVYDSRSEIQDDLDVIRLPEPVLSRVAILKNWTVIASCLLNVFPYLWSPNTELGTKIKPALRVSQFFSLVESVKVNDARELHMSYIHHFMYHIQNTASSDIPGDNIHHIRKRAKALLDKWAPLLLEDIKNRRWAYQGAHSIVYVPTDSAIRKSPDVLANMVYGPIFYPQKYSMSWYDLQAKMQFLD